MKIALIRLLVDFGMVVLIWIVQLCIYPSFKYYTSKNLEIWHEVYTQRITYVVLPLMLSQLLLGLWQLWSAPTWYSWISMVLIALTWITTFLIFVPIHGQLSGPEVDPVLLDRLVDWNWIRTFLWSVLFLISFYYLWR